MVKKFLKIAGVKTEAEFYKKYPSEAAFFKAHPEAKNLKQYKQGGQQKKLNQLTSYQGDIDNIIPIAQDGAPIGSYMSSPVQQTKMMNFSEYMNPVDKMITGSTQKERDEAAKKQAEDASKQSGGGFGDILNMASKFVGKAQKGVTYPGAAPGSITNPDPNAQFMWGNPSILGGQQTVPFNPNAGTNYDISAQTGYDPNIRPISEMGVKKKKPFDPLSAIPVAGQIYGGIQQIKAAKTAEKEANKQFQLSGLVKQAGLTRGEPIRRKYVRPEDQVINPNEMFPTYGVGTNYIAEDGAQVTRGGIGGNPTEIQNLYNPYNLFKDLGYEPLEDSQKVKQYQGGGLITGPEFNQLGTGLGAMVGGGGKGSPAGWSQTLGGVGSIFGPVGSAVGSIVGSVIDGRQQAKIRNFQERAQKNMVDTAMQQGMQGIQSQFSNVMEDGGYVSHDWQPQVIASFGGHRVSDLLKADPMMDTLRTGGHITQNEGDDMGPVSSMAMGGEMKTHWGGYAEPVSYNPFLPEGGETVMFRGQSHDESDGQGNTGIGVTYGDNPVEVERGEPAVKLRDGGTGEDNMVVYGNLKIPNQYLSEIGDPKAKGKKFKNYVKDLSQQEARHNKTVEKNLDIIDALDDVTSFDQMKFLSAKANIDGANMKLKQIADYKMNAAAVQNAINEAAEEHGLDADALAKGKFKLDKNAMNEAAKWGKSIKKAQNGTEEGNFVGPTPTDHLNNLYEMSKNEPNKKLRKKYTEIFQKEFHRFYPEKAKEIILSADDVTSKGKRMGIKNIDQLSKKDDKTILDTNVDGEFGDRTEQYHAIAEGFRKPYSQNTQTGIVPVQTKTTTDQTTHYPVTPYKGSTLMSVIGQVLPYIRPTNQEPLDPTQLYGEMYALATNQVDPVQAKLYHPLLEQPYDISLQDQLNANQADFNAIQRQTGYNPAATATLAAQKYAANSKVLADQFRMNQATKADIYNRNRQTLNQAQLQNLGILDQQMVRQATAKSRTKEVAQAALNSISDKILKQKLANRTLGVYENLYNYRFDKSGRAINMNAPFQPNIPNVLPVYDKDGNVVAYQQTDKTTPTTTGKSSAPATANVLKGINAANTAQSDGYIPLPDLSDLYTEETVYPTNQKKGGKTPARNRDILRAMKNL